MSSTLCKCQLLCGESLQPCLLDTRVSWWRTGDCVAAGQGTLEPILHRKVTQRGRELCQPVTPRHTADSGAAKTLGCSAHRGPSLETPGRIPPGPSPKAAGWGTVCAHGAAQHPQRGPSGLPGTGVGDESRLGISYPEL
ncbi:unnamed protein product [Rangifer tarandus platyrhynchus]|uniref:Uncharacterized protein n=2 Tax=Rangifer tarandus platyrhynchus TaxID=3082113 RepID=A0ACB0EDF2_RANTA|nr:unnamed protein product [Rangifer tarandus platyrhynchus]CAI9698717.1 unnamed protein product [Rangifer tarandus platyrhynchus]